MVQYEYRGGTSVGSQTLQLLDERRSFDAKQFGGLVAIAAGPFERAGDEVALDRGQIQRQVEAILRKLDEGGRGRRRCAMQLRREVRRVDLGAPAAQRDRP